MGSSPPMGSPWTVKQNNVFEKALADYDQSSPDFWNKVACAVGGGKSVEEVKRHFQLLVSDVNRIERGQPPRANFHSAARRG